MKYLFALILTILFLFNCSSPIDNCGEIDRKYEKNGEYFFALIMHEDKDSNDNSGGGRVYADVLVSKNDYLLKKLGEQYCFED